ncbi:MAG: aldo/keto reductase [Burkholderiaceae bacterium]|nr:aldo/keto reductase [Burkholderiaceae bacterium]
MKTRRIGRSELEVAPLCFGGNVFGWTVDEAQSFRLLDAWVDAGMNFIDTADVYSRWAKGNSGGESETIIGKWLARSGKRDRVVIASKVGMDMGEGRQGLSASYIRQAVEASLRRLQVDCIDLYQSHKDDPDTPQQETLACYERLIDEGKIRAIGASNFSAARLEEALAVSTRGNLPRYECLQPEYNLYDRAEYEREFEPVVRRHGLGVINFYGLARGFLSGKYRSAADAAKSVRGPGIVERYLDPRGRRILAALDAEAQRLDSTPASVAIAWMIARPSITAPIVSATTQEQLQALVDATRLNLDVDALARLDMASDWHAA